VLSALALSAASASAATVTTVRSFGTGTVSSSGLGQFSGSFTYAHTTGSNVANVTLSLTNLLTTSAGGKITAFAFNVAGNPSVTLGGLTTSSNHSSFSLYSNPTNENPWGNFEYSIALGSNFNGSGSPNPGIHRGATGTFNFTVSGSASVLASLSASTFVTQTVGNSGNSTVSSLLVRFKGFDNGGSDKVSAIINEPPTGGPTPPAIPAPLAGLAGGSLLGLAAVRRRR
jgi:hypothetical protein